MAPGTVEPVTEHQDRDRTEDSDQVHGLLAAPPQPPLDRSRFSAETLFGQPGIYPDGPPMAPAAGVEHSEAELIAALAQLEGTVGEVALYAYRSGRLSDIGELAYGASASAGRIVGPGANDTVGRRVVNERYRAEDPRLLLPSLVHALLWSGPDAGHAEETLLHALGAYAHAQLLARDPELGSQRTELARRQNSITITLLNSRRPGSALVTLVAADGPGTIPGGAPAMQTPDFWSVPFGPRDRDGDPMGSVVRETLAAAAGVAVRAVPATFDHDLGVWCSDAFVKLFDPRVQLTSARALGLLV